MRFPKSLTGNNALTTWLNQLRSSSLDNTPLESSDFRVEFTGHGFYLRNKFQTVGSPSTPTTLTVKTYDPTKNYNAGDVVLINPTDSIVTAGALDIHQGFHEYSKPGIWLCVRSFQTETIGTPPNTQKLIAVPTWPVPTPGDLPQPDCISYAPDSPLVYWVPIWFWPTTQFVITSFPTVSGSEVDYVMAAPMQYSAADGSVKVGVTSLAIAKAQLVRKIDSETIDGIPISYASYSNHNMQRTATGLINSIIISEKQVIYPRYAITGGDATQCFITAALTTMRHTGIKDATGAPVIWQELPGRVWASKFDQS